MKVFTKLHLLHWSYINRKTLEFNNGINFFTGGSGSGKSTVVDAMQFLLLGNPRGKYFNQAADEGSDREVIEYLCGMNASDGDANKTYLREGKDFSSYIVLEVFDEETQKFSCIGAVFDVNKLKEMNYEFFTLDTPLPKNEFINEKNVPMRISELKKQYEGQDVFKIHTYTNFPTELLNRRLGRLSENYFALIKKAVSLNPKDTSIRDIIARFVCGDETINIEDMQENFRIYKQLEQELIDITRKVEALREIQTRFESQLNRETELKVTRFMENHATFLGVEKALAAYQKESEKLTEEIKMLTTEMENITEQLTNIDNAIVDTRIKIQQSDSTIEINRIQGEIDNLKVKLDNYIQRGTEYAIKYKQCESSLKDIYEWEKVSGKNVESEEYAFLVECFKELELDEDGLKELVALQGKLRKGFARENANLVTECDNLTAEKEQLEEENEQLQAGMQSYPDKVTKVKKTLEQELSRRHKVPISIDVLADLLDIKDKSWTMAIEGYFKQKFSLVIDPKYCLEAIKIYNAMDRWAYGVDIIDTANIAKFEVKPKALAEEIITDNELARRYVNFALGDIIKCDSVEELSRHKKSIVREGMVYQGFIYRRLNPKHCESFYIGKDSIKKRLEFNNARIAELNKTYAEKQKLIMASDKASMMNVIHEQEIGTLLSQKEDILKITPTEEQISAKKHEISLIDASDVSRLEKKLAELTDKKTELEEDKGTKQKEQTDKIIRQYRLKEEHIPTKERERSNLQAKLSEFDSDVSDKGLELFALEKSKDYSMIANRCVEVALTVEDDIRSIKAALTKKRKEYNDKFGGNYAYADEDNKEYTDLLHRYEIDDLPNRTERAKQEKEKAFLQFKSDFICKLKESIVKAELQRDYINKSIRNIDFGKDRYELKIYPSKKYKEYYDMLTDSMLSSETDTLFSAPFEEKYQETIQSLFDKIIDTGDGLVGKQQLAENIRLFTDYRTYLEFDMVVRTGSAESHLSGMLSKSSGGERQNPYYIVVLAAFIQLYQMQRKKGNRNIRLVMFDEAFSKMGEDNIKDCVSHIKKLGFQCIIVAPDRMVQIIAPLVDKTFCFRNENKTSIQIADFEREDNPFLEPQLFEEDFDEYEATNS